MGIGDYPHYCLKVNKMNVSFNNRRNNFARNFLNEAMRAEFCDVDVVDSNFGQIEISYSRLNGETVIFFSDKSQLETNTTFINAKYRLAQIVGRLTPDCTPDCVRAIWTNEHALCRHMGIVNYGIVDDLEVYDPDVDDFS